MSQSDNDSDISRQHDQIENEDVLDPYDEDVVPIKFQKKRRKHQVAWSFFFIIYFLLR